MVCIGLEEEAEMLSIHSVDSGIKYFLPQDLREVFVRAKTLITIGAVGRIGDSVVVKDTRNFFEVEETNGHYKCARGRLCQQFFQQFNGLLCAHTLAAADWNGDLKTALSAIKDIQMEHSANRILHQAKSRTAGLHNYTVTLRDVPPPPNPH